MEPVQIIALVLAGLVLGSIPAIVAASRGHSNSTVVKIALLGVLGIGTGILWLLAFVFAFMDPGSSLVSSGHHTPGRFQIAGVDRRTGKDVWIVVEAANAENARVKGEMKGLAVTKVSRK